MSSFDWSGLQFACCFYLTGVIWVIQLTHYPAFSFIGEKDFIRFHARHTTVMGLIVGPVMVVELVTAIILCFQYEVGWLCNLAAVVVVWFSTFFLSVPCHNKLSRGLDPVEINKLVRSNWLRTVIWTMRSVLFFILLFRTKVIF